MESEDSVKWKTRKNESDEINRVEKSGKKEKCRKKKYDGSRFLKQKE